MRPRVFALLTIPALAACSAILGFDDYTVGGDNPLPDGGLDANDAQTDTGVPDDGSFLLDPIPDTAPIVRGATVTVRVKVRRGALMKAPITVTAGDLRDGIAQSGATVLAGDQSEGDVVIQAPAQAPQGPVMASLTAVGGGTTRTTSLGLFVRGAAGELDTSFGTAGISNDIVFDAAVDELPQDLVILPDGRMLLVGQCNTPLKELCVARVAPDGKLDTTFGTLGLARLPGEGAKAVFVEADGRFVVAGGRTPDVTFVARVNADGTADATFGDAGLAPIVPPSSDNPLSRADGAYGVGRRADGDYLAMFDYIADDGRLLVGAARLTTTGAPVGAFGFEGTSRSGWDPPGAPLGFGSPQAFHVTADGGAPFVVGVSPAGANSVLGVMQFNPGTGGFAPNPPFGRSQAPLADATRPVTTGLVTLADESSVVPFTTASGIVVAKLKPGIAGLDTTFGVSGLSAPEAASGAAGGIARDASGRIIVAVIDDAKTKLELLRYTDKGVLDATFGAAGHASAPAGASSAARRVAVQQDGKIIVLGARFGASAHMILARFWN